jgi:ethanolamine utilization microcompartment shell protein EutS
MGLDWTISRGARTLMRLSFSTPGEVGVISGDLATRRGWVSAAFGDRQPAPQLAWRGIVPVEGASVEFLLGL